jgi:hypothetical protein
MSTTFPTKHDALQYSMEKRYVVAGGIAVVSVLWHLIVFWDFGYAHELGHVFAAWISGKGSGMVSPTRAWIEDGTTPFIEWAGPFAPVLFFGLISMFAAWKLSYYSVTGWFSGAMLVSMIREPSCTHFTESPHQTSATLVFLLWALMIVSFTFMVVIRAAVRDHQNPEAVRSSERVDTVRGRNWH